MIIDFHTHVFPDKIASKTIDLLASNAKNVPYTDGTVDGLLKAMDRANADISIALPVLTKPTQFDSVTNFAIAVNQRFENESRKIISFGGMHPDCEDVEDKIRLLKDNGFLGFKIHPDYQETFIDDKRYIKILECAKEYDLIVVTHSGVDDGYAGKPIRCPVEKVREVIKKVDHKKFVLGHYGAHKQWEKVLELLSDLDVYFDTAYTLHEIDESLFKKILRAHGEDKILFATDCPWRDIKDDVEKLKSYKLDKETEEKILYKNALKLLGI